MYIKRKTEKENKLKNQHEIITKYLKYTLRLKKKRMFAHQNSHS